jgi:Large-conductance mechanosensitive channel, MscL
VLEGIQRVRSQGERGRSSGRCDYRRGFWWNRQFAGQRHHYAASESAKRWTRFFEQVYRLAGGENGSVDFHTPADAAKAGAITWNYGNFITLFINFLIVAGAVFLLVRAINRLKQPKHAEPVTKDCPACAMTIPIKAKRCPHCTTELSPQTAA